MEQQNGVDAKTLQKLKQLIEFKWRVQSFFSNNTKARMLAYVDARDVAEHLDEIVGPENWQDDYYEVKGTVYCKIGINVNGQWIWKNDAGKPAKMEAEKSEASDAFKRAAVKWGINREAYRLGTLELPAKVYKNKPYPCDPATGKFLKAHEISALCNQMIDFDTMNEEFIPEPEEEHSKVNTLFTQETDENETN